MVRTCRAASPTRPAASCRFALAIEAALAGDRCLLAWPACAGPGPMTA